MLSFSEQMGGWYYLLLRQNTREEQVWMVAEFRCEVLPIGSCLNSWSKDVGATSGAFGAFRISSPSWRKWVTG